MAAVSLLGQKEEKHLMLGPSICGGLSVFGCTNY